MTYDKNNTVICDLKQPIWRKGKITALWMAWLERK